MRRQRSLQQRLDSLSTLRDAVDAMRSLAAHHFRAARRTLADSQEYRRSISSMWDEISMESTPISDAPPGILVVASDLGLCGDYNLRVAEHAMEELRRFSECHLYVTGRKVLAELEKREVRASRAYDAPASLAGINDVLLGIVHDVFEDYASARIHGLFVVSAKFAGVGTCRPEMIQILPVPASPSTTVDHRSPYVDAEHLTFVAIREFLYISLYESLLEALAVEHSMRLVAAEAALEWLESTVNETSRQLLNVRAENATQELLDIVTGRLQRRT
ncbi:MAG: F0F1 ATP synthase subunit gamma [Planctomycetales bacterium]|nr:F0F1 ATP synthase subunit gamma [Planctomycetales bacterium]